MDSKPEGKAPKAVPLGSDVLFGDVGMSRAPVFLKLQES